MFIIKHGAKVQQNNIRSNKPDSHPYTPSPLSLKDTPLMFGSLNKNLLRDSLYKLGNFCHFHHYQDNLIIGTKL